MSDLSCGLCKGRCSPAATINIRAKLSVSMREFASEHHYCQILDAAAEPFRYQLDDAPVKPDSGAIDRLLVGKQPSAL